MTRTRQRIYMRTGRTATMMRINTRTRTNRTNVNRNRTVRIRRTRMRMRKRRMRTRNRRTAPALQKTKLLRLLSTLPLYSLQMKSDQRSSSPTSS